MTSNELNELIREKFTDFANFADVEYDEFFTGKNLPHEFPFTWLEFIAKICNQTMHKKVDDKQVIELFEVVRKAYMMGDDETKKTINVAFVENLFWNVKKENAKIYWEKLPPVLQQLYQDFHRKKPYE